MQGLARRTPVFVRHLPVFDEINAELGSRNLYFYEDTDDLVRKLAAGIPEWEEEADKADVHDWHASAVAIESNLQSALSEVRFEKLVERFLMLDTLVRPDVSHVLHGMAGYPYEGLNIDRLLNSRMLLFRHYMRVVRRKTFGTATDRSGSDSAPQQFDNTIQSFFSTLQRFVKSSKTIQAIIAVLRTRSIVLPLLVAVLVFALSVATGFSWVASLLTGATMFLVGLACARLVVGLWARAGLQERLICEGIDVWVGKVQPDAEGIFQIRELESRILLRTDHVEPVSFRMDKLSFTVSGAGIVAPPFHEDSGVLAKGSPMEFKMPVARLDAGVAIPEEQKSLIEGEVAFEIVYGEQGQERNRYAYSADLRIECTRKDNNVTCETFVGRRRHSESMVGQS
jgi:hypothetical protein